MKKKSIELYLSSHSDYSIEDFNGNKISLEDAEALWKAGKVSNWNLAFQRLAQLDFNVAACKEFYAKERERWLRSQAVTN